MLRETKTKVIGGEEYQVTQLGAVKGSQVFVKMLNVIGPMFAASGSADLSAAFAALKDTDVTYLIDAFTPYTIIPGKGELNKIFDIHFAGKYKEMLEWLFFSVEVNFGDFLGKFVNQNGVGLKTGASQLASQMVATGGSGGSS